MGTLNSTGRQADPSCMTRNAPARGMKICARLDLWRFGIRVRTGEGTDVSRARSSDWLESSTAHVRGVSPRPCSSAVRPPTM
jgi:hypothetical protein